MLLLAQPGFDSRIAYGAAPSGPSNGNTAQFANQEALRELKATTRSVMVRPRSAAAPLDYVQQAGGFAAQRDFAAMPGPQPVSYEVAQATINNRPAAKGAAPIRASRGLERRLERPKTRRRKPAPQPRANRVQAAAATRFGSKSIAADAADSQPAGKSATTPPRTLPDAAGSAPAPFAELEARQPPASIELDDAERRGAPSSVVAPGRVGGTATESDTASDIDRAGRAAAGASMTLLESSLTPGNDSAITGRTVTLAEALGRGSNHTQKFEIAELYWRLALAVANFNWAVDESKQLEALPAGQGAVDGPLLTTARAAAQARLLEAQALAVAAQQELADAIGQPTQNLPMTVEQPLVGPYRTLFDRLFAARSPPPRTRGIDRTLPLKRQAIDVRTAAVQAAASAVRAAEDAHAQGNADVLAVLAAHQDLARQRREFLRGRRIQRRYRNVCRSRGEPRHEQYSPGRHAHAIEGGTAVGCRRPGFNVCWR